MQLKKYLLITKTSYIMKNQKTTISTIFTVIGLVPQAIASLGIAEVPGWLTTVGLVCSALSFIYLGVNAKDAE